MLTKLNPLFGFCTQIIRNNKNSIKPISQHVAYGYYFPKEWTQEDIYGLIDPSRKNISHIQIMKNRVGTPTGKILFKFYTGQAMDKYILKYNEDFITTKQSAHRVIIKPFSLKTQLTKSQNKERRTRNMVSVKNLDFDITKQELERIAKDYGTVQFIEMYIRPNGLNNGIATIYFKKAKEAEDFSYFCHNLILRQRKLTSEVIKVKSKEKEEAEYLQQPKLIIQLNKKLYKRMVAQQASKKQSEQQKL